MKVLSPLFFVLLVAPGLHGCQRPADLSVVGDVGSVTLELLDGELSRQGLVQDYQVSNLGHGPIYFVCPESSCGDPETYMTLPFYEVHGSRTLAAYAYFARRPDSDLDIPLYPYVLKRVEPGETFRGRIEIAAPLQNNPPYPPPPFRPYSIDGFWLDRVQLTLGVLPCPEADLKPKGGGSPGVIPRFFEKRKVRCGASQGTAKDFQKLITAEAKVQWTGCWPGEPRAPGLPTSCDKEDAASVSR